MASKYKRHSRGGRFSKQGDGQSTAIDRIRQQRQTEIDALKQQALQQGEISKMQISGMSDVAKNESDNRRILQDLETKIYSAKRRAIEVRGQREVEALQGEASELGKSADFWLDFATKHSQNYGKLAKEATDYAQYRAAINAYQSMDPNDRTTLAESLKGAYDTVELDALGGSFQILKDGSLENGIPDFSSRKDAKELITKTHGSFANNHHLWSMLAKDFKNDLKGHLKEVRQNSFDRNGKNLYNSKNSGQLLLNYAYLYMSQKGIPLGSKAGQSILADIRGQVRSEFERLELGENYISDEEIRSDLGKYVQTAYKQYKNGDIDRDRWEKTLHAWHIFQNGSVVIGEDKKHLDLSKVTNRTKKDEWTMSYDALLDYVNFDSADEAEDFLNIAVLDKNGDPLLKKDGVTPQELLLDKHSAIKDLINKKIKRKLDDAQVATENNIRSERRNTLNSITSDIEEATRTGDFSTTLLNPEWVASSFKAVSGDEYKNTTEQSDVFHFLNYDPALYGNNFAKQQFIKSEYIEGDINGAHYHIGQLKNIPEGFAGVHESINSLRTYGFNSTKLKTIIAAEFSSNLKADVAIRKAFQNTGDVSTMTDVALARFMDLHLDFADIKNPTLRYQKTYEALKAEIKEGFDKGIGLFAVTKESPNDFGFKFEYFNQDLNPTELISQADMQQLVLYDFDQPEGVAYRRADLTTVIEKNLNRLVTSNDIKGIMKTFLQGTTLDSELPLNLKNFVVEARKIYPNMTTRDVMNEVLTVITADEERGYNKYKDTTWPMNNEDLTKDICGVSYSNSRHNQVACINKVLKNNGIDLNAVLGERWKTN